MADIAPQHPRKKLIEVSIPLEAINAESSRRKQKAPKGYPTAIHKYWAQRPVAACRAVLFAQLVDDPSGWPDRFKTEKEQDEERKRLHKLMERLVLWEASNDEAILNEARWEIARSIAWGLNEEPPAKGSTKAISEYLFTKGPPVFDPFSGGGSIPLEAQRLGLRSYGSDLNPIAVLIGKSLVEIPPRFHGNAPVNPVSQMKLKRGGEWNSRGAEGLAEDVRYYGQWLCNEAHRRIGSFYPEVTLPNGHKGTVVAWLWARTVRSPDPSAKGAMVPLVSSFILSNKDGRKVWVEPTLDPKSPDGYRFEVKAGTISKADEARLRVGTIGRSTGGICVLSGASMPFTYVRNEGQTVGLGVRLMAIVADGPSGRVYLSPSTEQETVALQARPQWEPEGELPSNPRDFKTPNYGMSTFASIFTPRQLLGLTTLSDLVHEARKQIILDAGGSEVSGDATSLDKGGCGATAYAHAVATYLAMVIDRMAFYGSSLCGWLAKDNAMGKTMPQQALAMSWDFAEGNPFGKSSASIATCTKAVADCIVELRQTAKAEISNQDAQNIVYKAGAVISTDPPYYDNVGYADLSDFFYCWLKPTIGGVYPDLFRRLSTPKDSELVATPYRHGGANEAEQFFMEGMRKSLLQMRTAKSAYPMAIYYAFKQQEQTQIGVTSAGWAGFLQAIVDAGFGIDGTWPIRTENPSRSIAQGANALASSIVLVCRERDSTADVVTRGEFIRALRRELPDAIDDIRKAGVGPVDMQQSVIGPGMGIFSRYAKVLEDDDSAMPVKTALSLINRVWEEIENELESNFDPETQVALAWFATYGFDARTSGELITLANAKNIASNSLFDSGVFKDLKGKAALTPRDDLSKEWRPITDKSLTVWKCVQHTARVLNAEDGGAAAAGRLVAEMGPRAAEARALAYRLFEIATQKGWSAEALVYNELAQEWPRLEDLASTTDARDRAVSSQAELF
ncbi:MULTISPECIES: DUF1156 domain-containing protein [unclassified Bradyrhizobium]|uniref:DUF1156 domain-containing protein n=1 Tax=unclassified Bradyrhizobium TaxID=2631580 RepID=UPI001CD25607|nr:MULTISPECIES: DUF1156 domain-containing protein [unclassified Bradyrhizobium]MCA1427333.1 DUF1156 domain-containing protein [Bradyrhizobium sp. NBAIM16]MCA1506853.1 DUF1156 domain-containing protein [Bradyrhizobium sp. NBAIM02]